jgi:poly(A) polymerase
MIPERLEWLVDPAGVPARLAQRFSEEGFELYLVGGSVRDLLMDERPTDLDFATNALPQDIKRVVRSWADDVYTVGEAFGTIGAMKDGVTCEITTFRSDVYQGDSRKPEVTFSGDIETDLSRRDFTVNAMALRLPSPELVDPHGGTRDLAARVLRTPREPEVSFGDDPLRMLRLFRFDSTLGFVPDPSALGAVREMRDRLGIVSAERIEAEFSKLMVGEHVSEGLSGLIDTGLINDIVPELPALRMEQDPMHRHKDVLAHTLAVVGKTEPKLRVRLAALLHDIGKPATRAYGPNGVTFHHHEVVGARLARDRLKALRFPKHVIEDVGRLVYLHLRPHTLKMGWTDSAVRRYVRDAGPLLDDLNQLVRCDVTTRNPKRARAIQRRIDELEQRIAQLREKEELARLRPPIDGHDVMAYTGLEPGPLVGEIMDILTEHRIEHGPYGQDAAYRIVREWAIGKGLDDPGERPAPVE